MEQEVFYFPSEKAQYRLVLLHGWGADAEDLMPLGMQLIQGIDEPIELLSLRAPQPHPQGIGRQWYRLFPPDWKEAEKSVIELRLRLEKISTLDIPLEKTVLFGFSQGGAMAIAAGCKLPLAGLVVCSGYSHKILDFHEDIPPVFLSHGKNDPVVPIEANKELEKLFYRNKRICENKIFNGGHEIPQEIYGDITFFIRRCFIDNS